MLRFLLCHVLDIHKSPPGDHLYFRCLRCEEMALGNLGKQARR